jgi:hypothetical protein
MGQAWEKQEWIIEKIALSDLSTGHIIIDGNTMKSSKYF